MTLLELFNLLINYRLQLPQIETVAAGFFSALGVFIAMGAGCLFLSIIELIFSTGAKYVSKKRQGVSAQNPERAKKIA